ncbi:hypothetical protein [Novosphingobium rosa]|uniref:hypothetical protein n=1 Tax=Novosphingobium rosa TaxID=76978 RepID=UPI00082CC4AF|nr:hypothetical protein [Novosphingobium rosa]
MKFAIATLAVAASLMTVGVANAQPGQWRPGPWNPGAFWRGAPDNPYERLHFLRERVGNGLRDGSLDRREAARVSRELDGVDQWIRRMHWEDAGRLTPGQRAQVQARLDGISRQIHWMRRNG